MKYLFATLTTYFITLSGLSAWVIEEPIDYPKLMQESDLCGIVKVLETKDTGQTKVLFKDGVKYREVQIRLKVLSNLKGDNPTNLDLSIYRIPTMEELKEDGIKKDDTLMVYSNLISSEVVHIYFASAKKGDTLLVYLKGDSKSNYKAVTGDDKPSQSIFSIETSSTIRSSNMLDELLKQRNQ